MYRQGDLLFIKINGDPVGRKINSKVIIQSNVTGHAHSVTAGFIYVNDRPDSLHMGNFYLDVRAGGAKVVHPEHRPIPLEEGVYEVRRQREVTGYVAD